MYAGWSEYQVSLETSDHPVQIQVKYLAVEIKARYWRNLASVRFDDNEIDTYTLRLNSDVPPVASSVEGSLIEIHPWQVLDVKDQD